MTVGGVALDSHPEQTSFDEARPSDSRRRSSADRDNVVDALVRDFDVTIPVEAGPLPNSLQLPSSS